MHIIFSAAGDERELEVRLRSRDARLADLLRAVDDRPVPVSVLIDGRPVDSSAPIEDSGLREGSRLVLSGRDPVPAGEPDRQIAVLAGLDSGRTFPLAGPRAVIGRDQLTDVPLRHATVSRRHAAVTVEDDVIAVTDLGAANGVAVNGKAIEARLPRTVDADDVITVGALALQVRPARRADRPRSLDLRRHAGADGTVSFNRPPRPAPLPPPDEVTVPAEPAEPSKPHFSIVSTVGPLVLAVVLVVVTKNLTFALFALLSPLIGIGTYVESRRRTRKEKATGGRKYEAELEDFSDKLVASGEVERRRLRERLPDLAEVLRRAELPSTRLWERRPGHTDFLALNAGLADCSWTPPVRSEQGRLPAVVRERVARARLIAAPVEVDLSNGGVVGVVGDRRAALAVARGLICQAAVLHGPADLTVGVFADPGREPEWDWCKWLPHTRRPDGAGQWLAAYRERSEAMLQQLAKGAANGTVLVVLDSDVLTDGNRSPARDLLNAARVAARPDYLSTSPQVPVAGIVLAATADRLPAACDTVIEAVGADGDATVRRPGLGTAVDDVLLGGLSMGTARRCARDLARFDDPELRLAGAGLPDGVRLLPMLGLAKVDAASILDRWRRSEPASAAAPLGVTERGVFGLDLVQDGPHGLIGGTTGSGKSELLRSLVAALAAQHDPTQLTFVLMDYKGGAAFDECARLPHTVGMVTDLDEQLGERALRALEAELRHRERQLRAAGADNLVEYVRQRPAEPMPRLVVVIDEFATMAAELPDFLSALVGIAQRGRTLGVHLILATQRPSGAVNDNIRTNTNLRIALRVQDQADSTDVLGVADAAQINRRLPGRAYVRLGPGEVVPIQTALVTCVTPAEQDAPVDVRPFVFGHDPADDASPAERDDEARTDLARLVGAIADAYREAGLPAPRRPWPEPLGDRVDLTRLPAVDGRAAVALADDPTRQIQFPYAWDPADGNVLLFGIPGSGTTTTLQAIALSLAATHGPEELELYALDHGTGGLGVLEALPHTGAVVAADDRERQVRLIRHLRSELDRRRGARSARRIVVLIDNLGALRAEFDDAEGTAVLDVLTRLYADGPAAGISFAVSADRLTGVPGPWVAVTTQRWLFRLPDPYDYVQAGLNRKDVPAPVPGRMVVTPDGLQAQVGLPLPSAGAVAEAVAARHPGAARWASPIGVLPAAVTVDELARPADLSDEPWHIPLGVRESDLDVTGFSLYEGEHALVAGPARSGKSTTLLTLAAVLRRAGDTRLVATGSRRSPLKDSPDLDLFAAAGGAATAMLVQLRTQPGRTVLFVDDAETFDDADGALAGLLAAARPDLHVIIAGRADTLRGLYGHWTQAIRRSKTGLLLRPSIDLDGDLVGITLPRRSPVTLGVGRGYLVHNGDWDIVQVANSSTR
ncbi:FtsK/SpoIIIE domain-containing protein [Actinoplanes sp. TRM 88003]|uniref:FtsK/SpoIIIE domain-containing protein n=1 Tax=Paractinoplanes aksuensis TaxID=2939490 RepID=A0ABT1E5R8_9ACTN|nr:FtsK/SpoIIIE domain-containing protein [Actinoplanes aksuensis]MCO8277495.1 FtsK/SpoIIIE domain-containing protein [Actinoplanes aksuensis]